MKKIVLTSLMGICVSFMVNAQLSQSDQCEIIAQAAGCEAYENGTATWEEHYGIIDTTYGACMAAAR